MKRFTLFTQLRSIVLAAFAALTLSGPAVADVTAIVEVPNGTTNFYSLIQWTLAPPGEIPVGFELEVAPGMTASDIAFSMALESNGFFGIDAASMGNTYTADDVVGSLETSPAEIDITWIVSSPPGTPVPHPDFDLVYETEPRWFPAVSLCLKGEKDTGCTFPSDSLVMIQVNVGKAVLEEFIPVYEGETTDQVMTMIDKTLRSRRLPSEIRYDGLVGGYPTLVATSPDDTISVLLSTDAAEKRAVEIGYSYYLSR